MSPSSLSSKRKRDQSSLDDEPESSSKRSKNDVFINYSFEDIGNTFISHLRAALIRNGFAISDHTMLPVGQNMRLELLKAIEESEMYVVVFSPDYASSVRSLDELVDIMDCVNKFDERKVVPVFYKVEPSDVRSQQGPFMEPFQAHHTNTNLHPERVLKWRYALKDAGQLSGLPLQNGSMWTRNYLDSSNVVGGLPLILKVWSSHFNQYGREQWPSILGTLKRIPHGDAQKQLQLSYDSLTPRLKKLFLDIACFFDVDDETDYKDLVVKVFEDEDSRFFPNNEIQYPVDKSLVKITSDNKLWMHHAIREMGLEVVRQENEDEPGQRTRLWDQRDVMCVLTECSGTKSVESISVTLLKDTHDVTLNAFGKMSNLRLIYVWIDGYAHSFSFHDKTTHLCFKKLKYMHWFHFPFKSLDNFDMCNVVVLTLRESRLETLWEGIKFLSTGSITGKIKMAPTTRNNPESSGSNPDPIVVQLAAIAARLESMESLKEDVATLKAHAMPKVTPHSIFVAVMEDTTMVKLNGDPTINIAPTPKLIFQPSQLVTRMAGILKAEKYFRYYHIPDDK